MKITGPYEKFKSTSIFFEDISEAANRGYKVNKIDDIGIQDLGKGELFSSTNLAAWIGAGGEVIDMPLYIKMESTVVDNNVISGMPNRLTADGEVRKWEEWHDANRGYTGPRFNVAGDECVVSCQGFEPFLTTAEIQILLDAGYELLTNQEYIELMSTPGWTVEVNV